MSASMPHAYSPAMQGLLADLVLAGVAFELQDEPTRWQGGGGESVPVPVTPAPAVAREPVPAVAPVAKPVVTPILEVMVPYTVWQRGEPGGVAVVLGGAEPLGAAETTLLQNMLKAVGLNTLPLAFVGLDGSPAKAQQAAVKAEIVAVVGGYTPQHTLVLGQALLGLMLGKLQGVEGWQAAPTDLGLPGRVGVTFPLDLLLNKPLFKGLAWQHLQAWQRGEDAHA